MPTSYRNAPVLAVDVGGTTIKVGLVNTAGEIAHERRVATPRGGAAVLAAIQSLVAVVCGEQPDKLTAIGVSVPGVVDEELGTAVHCGNLGWQDVPFGKELAGRLDLPVTVGQDVRNAGRAEARYGVGRRRPDFLLVGLGTGVSAVRIIEGSITTGATGSAIELGHIPVPSADISMPCGCGGRGCLETVVGAAALSRQWSAAGDGGARALVTEVAAGDRAAGRVWHRVTRVIAEALHAAVLHHDPAAVVLGGGVSLAGDLLLDPIRGALASLLVFREPPPLLLSPLGDRASLLGAAVLAQERYEGTVSV